MVTQRTRPRNHRGRVLFRHSEPVPSAHPLDRYGSHSMSRRAQEVCEGQAGLPGCGWHI